VCVCVCVCACVCVCLPLVTEELAPQSASFIHLYCSAEWGVIRGQPICREVVPGLGLIRGCGHRGVWAPGAAAIEWGQQPTGGQQIAIPTGGVWKGVSCLFQLMQFLLLFNSISLFHEGLPTE